MKVFSLLKRTALAIMVMSMSVVLLSCNNKQKEVPKEEVKVEVITPDGTKDFTLYTYEQKEEAVNEANKEIEQLNEKIDEWKADANAKSDELSAEAKAKYEKAIADLEKTRDEYKADVEKLQNSTQEDWEQLKKDVGRKYDNTKKKFESGWENFKDDVDQSVEDVKKSLK